MAPKALVSSFAASNVAIAEPRIARQKTILILSKENCLKSLLNNDLDNLSLCFIVQKNLVNKALEKNLEQKLKKLLWNVIEVGRKSDSDVI